MDNSLFCDAQFNSQVTQSVLKAHDDSSHVLILGRALPRLYKAVLRPQLEYGNILLYPRFKCDAQAVE